MLPYYCRTSVRQQHTWHCPLEFEHSTRFIHHTAYLSTASTTCGRFSPRTAWRKDISCLEGTPMHDAANELRRIPLLGTGVKIAPAAAHFHGFGVARQGPWITWVNKRSRRVTLPARVAELRLPE